jgi:surface antigen/Spy/CpxP family protein refolding chaperone
MHLRLASILALSTASLLLAAPLAGQGTGAGASQPAAADPNEDADARWRRLQAESAARLEADRRARQSYEDGVRESAEARARYEEGLRQHQAEVARLEAERVEYERRRAEADRQRAEYDRQMAGRGGRNRSERRRDNAQAATTPATDTTPVASARCDEQMARNRRRGRGIGSLIGAGAGLLGSRVGAPAGLLAAALPVGAILGDAIARRLNRCEQEQAAAATEEAVRGGVGTTATWTSETRPAVTGTSVVTAAETSSDGECLTVTDIIIVDGEETRAPKRMCRRPPSTRFVRV